MILSGPVSKDLRKREEEHARQLSGDGSSWSKGPGAAMLGASMAGRHNRKEVMEVHVQT